MSKLSRFSLKTKMDEINYFNDVYSDMFSLNFDNLFSTADLESLEMKENDTIVEVDNTYSELSSQKQIWKQTTYRHQTSPGSLSVQTSKFKKPSNRQKIKT